MIDTTAIRKNLKLLIDNDPWIVVDFQFVKPGKGQAIHPHKAEKPDFRQYHGAHL